MAQSTQGVGVMSGLSDQQRITSSLKDLGLSTSGKNQVPQGTGTPSSAPNGTTLDPKR